MSRPRHFPGHPPPDVASVTTTSVDPESRHNSDSTLVTVFESEPAAADIDVDVQELSVGTLDHERAVHVPDDRAQSRACRRDRRRGRRLPPPGLRALAATLTQGSFDLRLASRRSAIFPRAAGRNWNCSSWPQRRFP